MKKSTITAIVIIIVCGFLLWLTTPVECRPGGAKHNTSYCTKVMS